MRTTIWILGLVACGGGGGSDVIPSTPLAGELDAVPWIAGGAIANASQNEGKFSVRIHPDPDLACDSFGEDPYVQIGLPWIAGSQELGLQSDVVLFIMVDSTAHLVLDGRIELDDAPIEPGATALLRLRASFVDDDNDMFVEGEITVQICD